MYCEGIELRVESLQPRDVAKAMLRFWLYQHEQARQARCACESRLEGGLRANRMAKREYEQSDQGLGYGFGFQKPFSDNEIQQCKDQLPGFQKNEREANAMAGYMINFITDKAHPCDSTS